MAEKKAYYNENDPYCAAWLRNLIVAGHIAGGDVDERSIVDVHADDLRGYTQCHFFAGVAGWSLALILAGWPDGAEVWTGSCPCQPLSCAGQRKGHVDERHLWPAFYNLIAEHRPAIVFGEQVGGTDGIEWLSAVRADLEASGYAVGAADLPAASVGAPHIRQRLFFVADAGHRTAREFRKLQEPPRTHESPASVEGRNGGDRAAAHSGAASGMVDPALEQVGLPGRSREQGEPDSGLGDATGERSVWGAQSRRQAQHWAQLASSPWATVEWLPCIDGKQRSTQPGLHPLVDGVSGRAPKLRAYGNAIVPQVAAEFIGAFMQMERGFG